jgi:parallel beta-helix repeat protein
MTKNQTFLVKIGILIIFLLIIMNFFAFSTERNKDVDESDTYYIFDATNFKSSVISGNIHIDGNSGWVDLKNDGNCSGEGTYSNPYIIENLVINAGGSGSCIFIENSNVYFRITNCTVYNSDPYWLEQEAGIKLSNVHNGELSNNTCTSNYHGFDVNNGNNLIISGNIINYNQDGIRFRYCVSSTIVGNCVEFNNDRNHRGLGGISLFKSNNNTIMGNSANNNDNGSGGISLLGSDNNTLTRNTANDNYNVYGGIRLSGSNNNSIKQNIVNHNAGYGGISLSSSKNNVISQNNVCHNTEGIDLDYDCELNVISKNNVSNNKFWGIYLIHCDENTIFGNTVSYNNKTGIALESSRNNIISGNTANSNKGYGIFMYESSCNNIVYDNTLLNNINGSISTDLSCGEIFLIPLFLLLGVLSFAVIIRLIRKKLKQS